MDASALFRVDGMVAAVTGGATGIGLMMAKALAHNGASKVYILGRRKDKLDAAAAETKGLIALPCDICSRDSLQAAVDYITNDAGYINLFIANCGIYGPYASFSGDMSIKDIRKAMFEDQSMQEFTHVLHVNTTATFYSMLAFLELLDAGNKAALCGAFGSPLNRGGAVPSIQSQVIVTSSVGAFLRDHTVSPAYAASKAAIVALVKLASTGLAEHGIRVNALAPGWFPSEMSTPVIQYRDPSAEPADHPEFIPARRFGGDEEMAGTVLYLASRAGSFCNGLVLLNDGGRSAVTRSTY